MGKASDLRILLVDGDVETLPGYVDELTNSGLAVEMAQTPMEALQKFRDTKFDAVILDIMMPSAETGFGDISIDHGPNAGLKLAELFGEIRPEVPILLFTIRWLSSKHQLSGNVVDVLNKTATTPDDLMIAVHRAVRDPRPDHLAKQARFVSRLQKRSATSREIDPEVEQRILKQFHILAQVLPDLLIALPHVERQLRDNRAELKADQAYIIPLNDIIIGTAEMQINLKALQEVIERQQSTVAVLEVTHELLYLVQSVEHCRRELWQIHVNHKQAANQGPLAVALVGLRYVISELEPVLRELRQAARP